ncbi:hypothetical protein FALBO_2624 [Fusarium albosuccineum]|uniref:Uncharacterized protein n=1 Tax=Fusarium albosuccineum TaxID=1237068 RepID=A0A8H4PHR0_9HYPO|nr:hypothetical protein FALBO_2624 [Fusarium albosuccineum]
MSSPIPVVICGKIPSHQEAVPKALQPDYEVLQLHANVESFAKGFPELLKAGKKPAAIFMGGGFDRDEFEAAYSVEGAASVPWLRPLRTKPGNESMMSGEAPPAHVVASVARGAIDEHLDVVKAGKGAGEIWYY